MARMKKIGTVKIRFYHAIVTRTLYESHTGVKCVRLSGPGGMGYFRLVKNPKAGQKCLAASEMGYGHAQKCMTEPALRTTYGLDYDPPPTKNETKKTDRKSRRRKILLVQIQTLFTKAERRMLLDLTKDELNI